MRILLVVHQYFPEFQTGTERVTRQLARMAQRAGHHVEVLTCMLDRARHTARAHPQLAGVWSSVVDGVPVTLLERASLPRAADHAFDVSEPLVEPLARWLRERGFEVVHMLHTMRMATAVAAIQCANIPMVLTLTDFFPACYRVNLVDQAGQQCTGPNAGAACAARCPTTEWLPPSLVARHRQAEAFMRYSSARVAPSAYLAERYRAIFPQLPIEVISHGVDLLAIDAAGLVQRDDSAHVLGFVGTLIPSKGLNVLLDALALVPELTVKLLVAGSFHGDAAYEHRIRSAAARDARVQLLGRLDATEVARLLKRTDLLCLPSQVPESFSLVVHEAAAVGVPSLVSDLGAPAQMIGAGGAAVAAADARAWAAALHDWGTDPALRQRWKDGVRLPHRVEEEAFLYEGLYRSAIGGARPSS